MGRVPTDTDLAVLNRVHREEHQRHGRNPTDQEIDAAFERELTTEGKRAEEGVVGCLLLNAPVVLPLVTPIVRGDQFRDSELGHFYIVVARLAAEGKPVDNLSWLLGELPKFGVTERVRADVVRLAGQQPHYGHAVYYAEQVRDAHRKRRLLGLAGEIERMVSDDHEPDAIEGMLRRYSDQRIADTVVRDAFELLTYDDLANAPEQEYLARGLIPRLQPGVIGAPYKGMKSSICCDIAASLATGGYVLGYFKVPRPVRVLFMSAESGTTTLFKTTESVRIAGDMSREMLRDNLQWCTTLPRLGIDDDLRKLDAAYRSFPFEVLIADPLYKMCGGDGAENVMKQGEKFMHLQKWCDTHGVTLIFVHHLTKPSSRVYEPAELGDLSYAGIAEHVRWWLLLSRREKYLPPDPVHKLWLSAGGSAGHSGLWALDIDLGEFREGEPRQWNVTLQEAQEVRQEAAEKKAAAKNQAKEDAAKGKAAANLTTFLKTLAKFPEGETKSVLKTHSGMNTATIDAAIHDALKLKQIEVCPVLKGGRKQPRDGYRLVKSEASGPSGPSGQNSQLSELSECQKHPDGLPYVVGGSPSPDAFVQNPHDADESIRTEEAA